MIKKVSALDEAAVRLEMRKLYQEIGYQGMLQVFYELVTSARICGEVTKEELLSEKED